jgi:hypothetical protein
MGIAEGARHVRFVPNNSIIWYLSSRRIASGARPQISDRPTSLI